MLFEAATFNFRDMITSLQDYGIYDVFLPFLLIFAIVFAILEKTKIFGDDKTNINAVVSLVIGFLLIAQKNIVEIINSFLPRVSLIIIVILMFLIILSMLAGDKYKGLQGSFLSIMVILVAIAIVIALTPSVNIPIEVKDWLLKYGLFIALLVGAYFLIVGSKKSDSKSFMQKLDDIVSKGIK